LELGTKSMMAVWAVRDGPHSSALKKTSCIFMKFGGKLSIIASTRCQGPTYFNRAKSRVLLNGGDGKEKGRHDRKYFSLAGGRVFIAFRKNSYRLMLIILDIC
jgi:hypothetical protein